MIEQSGQHISRSRISDFENGHTHSTKFLQLYVLADTTKQNELSKILKQATDDYISYLAKLPILHWIIKCTVFLAWLSDRYDVLINARIRVPN